MGDISIDQKHFKNVALTFLRQEDMDKDVAVIDNNPLGIAVAVIFIGLYNTELKKVISDTVGDSRNLHCAVAFAYNKVRYS